LCYDCVAILIRRRWIAQRFGGGCCAFAMILQ
jgi:hypothetical protein